MTDTGDGAPGVAEGVDTTDPDAWARSEWERHARWWQANFSEGADPEYSEQMIPLLLDHLQALAVPGAPSSADGPGTTSEPVVLDVGAGEGQIGRAVVTALGWQVLGVDRSWAQLREARRRGGGPAYISGEATRLPLRGSSIDAAVACLLLEHVADLDSTLGELARVLRRGGRLLIVVNHPIVATPGSGWIDDHVLDPPERYWQLGAYLPEVTTRERVADGVVLTFHHRPLSRYLNTARELGLVLVHMDEPAPPPGFIALAPEYAEQSTMPRMMLLCLERL